MGAISSLNLPQDLKERIERAARARKESPSSLVASAVELFLEAEELQVEEARRRIASRSAKTVRNEEVMSWLDTWGSANEKQPPECE